MVGTWLVFASMMIAIVGGSVILNTYDGWPVDRLARRCRRVGYGLLIVSLFLGITGCKHLSNQINNSHHHHCIN